MITKMAWRNAALELRNDDKKEDSSKRKKWWQNSCPEFYIGLLMVMGCVFLFVKNLAWQIDQTALIMAGAVSKTSIH